MGALLLEAARGFVLRHLYGRDFLLLSRMDDISIPNVERAPVALGLVIIFIGLVVTGIMTLLEAALLLVAALPVSKCMSIELAQRSIQVRVLLAIGASLALLMTNHEAAVSMSAYCSFLW